MSTGETRDSDGRGDHEYHSDEKRMSSGEWWFAIWDQDPEEDLVAIRSEGDFPVSLEAIR